MLFNLKNKNVFTPGTERSEPKIPVKARLVRSVNARSPVQILRFVTELVGCPGLAVARSLELDFIAVARHSREEPELIGNPKRLERTHRQRRQRHSTRKHRKQQDRRSVEHPC